MLFVMIFLLELIRASIQLEQFQRRLWPRRRGCQEARPGNSVASRPNVVGGDSAYARMDFSQRIGGRLMISRPVTWLGVAVAAVLLAATPAHPQDAGNGFLFKAPAGAVTLRGGFDRANAGS